MAKKLTVIESNAISVRARLDRGGVVRISARYGRSDHNGGHVCAVSDWGEVLGRASGGGYDLRCAAMWRAVQGVLAVPTHQLSGNGSDRFGVVYANFSHRWGEFFGQFGWLVETYETYNTRGHGIDYVAIIRKAQTAEAGKEAK